MSKSFDDSFEHRGLTDTRMACQKMFLTLESSGMIGKLADQIPAHVPTIYVAEWKSSDGVVTAGQGNPLVRMLWFWY